jgi:hypothetical protein
VHDPDEKGESFMPDRAGRHATAMLLTVRFVVFALALVAMSRDVKAQDSGPTKHFSVGNPAELSDADAENIYRRLSGPLKKGYRLSNHPVARAYQSWPRFNTVPYRSEAHGERFVNNYANGMGRAYGSFEKAGDMPVGSVVAKDSFAVTAAGDVTAGPLFIMEKMPQGFNEKSRDWRYTMIMPDGSVFGVTNGSDSRKVQFCITCHQRAGAENDHLYFLPDAYR